MGPRSCYMISLRWEKARYLLFATDSFPVAGPIRVETVRKKSWHKQSENAITCTFKDNQATIVRDVPISQGAIPLLKS